MIYAEGGGRVYVDILILAHLSKGAAHGYEIKKRVEQTTGGGMAINNNLLYPALKRFEEMGAVAREVKRTLGRPDRHVYRLTDRGDEVLHGLLREFPADLARDEAEFITRVAFFDLLDPPARLEILCVRETALRRRLGHFAEVLPVERRAEHPGGARVVAFLTGQIEHELDWIAALAHEIEDEGEHRL